MKSANHKRLTEVLAYFRDTEREYYQGHEECANECEINRLYDSYQFEIEHLASTLQKILQDEK